jgi:hypothetical protein
LVAGLLPRHLSVELTIDTRQLLSTDAALPRPLRIQYAGARYHVDQPRRSALNDLLRLYGSSGVSENLRLLIG